MAIQLEKHELRSYKIKKRKRKQLITILSVFFLIAVIGFIIFIVDLILHKNYTSYQVIHSTERNDSNSAQYERYETGVIRYSRDGAMAMDGAGNLLWNGTFEMKDPIIDVCDKYAVVSDRGYKTVQVFNGDGGMTTINVINPIIKTEIANQGVVAVLMDGDGVNYIEIYSEDGESLVDTRTVNEKDGFPVDFSLSNDGRKVVTSYISINGENMQSKITFYNFGEVGKNYVNRVVGGFDYGQTIVPNIEFINNNTVCAFGDDRFSIYSMEQTPKAVYEETFKTEIKSVFHSGKYVGFVLENGEGDDKYRILLYDLKGKIVLNKTMNYDYDNIFLSGEEIILYSNLEWIILRLDGREKFNYTFENEISYIMPVNNRDQYIIIDNLNMEEVKLTDKKR